jgi:hypothetical protein
MMSNHLTRVSAITHPSLTPIDGINSHIQNNMLKILSGSNIHVALMCRKESIQTNKIMDSVAYFP